MRVVVASVFLVAFGECVSMCFGVFNTPEKKHSRTHTPPKLLCAHTHMISYKLCLAYLCDTQTYIVYYTFVFLCSFASRLNDGSHFKDFVVVAVLFY